MIKKIYFVAACLCLALATCTSTNNKNNVTAEAEEPCCQKEKAWNDYNVGVIHFEDKAVGTEGSRIYNSIIPNPEEYIAMQARKVLNTLYFSPNDSIVPCKNLYYTLEDSEGISMVV